MFLNGEGREAYVFNTFSIGTSGYGNIKKYLAYPYRTRKCIEMLCFRLKHSGRDFRKNNSEFASITKN